MLTILHNIYHELKAIRELLEMLVNITNEGK